MFSVTTDPSRRLVLAYISGLLSPEDVHAFSAREQQAVREMGCGDGEFSLLIDTSGSVIQLQEVVAAFQYIVARSPLKARRIAVVRGNSLTRMQTQRILSIRENAAVFCTVEEAVAWLFADDERATIPAQHAALG